jgi:hypothetical protein
VTGKKEERGKEVRREKKEETQPRHKGIRKEARTNAKINKYINTG